MRVFIGVDPGMSGGIAVIGETGAGYVRMSKFSDKTEADISELFNSVRADIQQSGGFAVIERVHSMPKQGVASSFKFGQSYGFLRGMLIAHGIPFEEVTPQKWQKAMGCLTKGDKNVSKARAQQLFPEIAHKITHATADALLLAFYAGGLYAS
jgi:Holliday junction resolvasome RuvABC endonuclease subunit